MITLWKAYLQNASKVFTENITEAYLLFLNVTKANKIVQKQLYEECILIGHILYYYLESGS